MSTLVSKACNALIFDTQVGFARYSVAAQALGIEPHERALSAVPEGFRRFYGALWVGGRVELTASHLAFTPNAINRLVHKADYSWQIPLADITSLSLEFGLLSGIIRISALHGTVKIRCFGARGFLSRIAQQQEHVGRD
jgi:hypothetical protein